jgi:hypothetical protein
MDCPVGFKEGLKANNLFSKWQAALIEYVGLFGERHEFSSDSESTVDGSLKEHFNFFFHFRESMPS